MNNEIKEILDKLKDDDWYDELDLTGDKWIELKQTETKQILDYITILQQDTEMYAQLKDEYEEEIKELQQENDDLKNDLENEIADNKLRWQEYNFFKNKYIEERTKNAQAIDKLKRDYYIKKVEHNDNVIDEALNILQNGSDDNG